MGGEAARYAPNFQLEFYSYKSAGSPLHYPILRILTLRLSVLSLALVGIIAAAAGGRVGDSG